MYMTIGLFPLNVVMFPTTRLPLHIYEPRYRTLMADSIRTASPFGIVSVENDFMNTVGVACRVRDVPQQFPDGRFDVIVEGIDRFSIRDVRDDMAPYLVATIEPLEDSPTAIDDGLRREVATMYNTIADLVFGTASAHYEPDEDDRLGSWVMAPKSGLEVAQKQQLLELRSENLRLEFLLRHLKGILPTIRKAEFVQRVIRNDGYFSTQ